MILKMVITVCPWGPVHFLKAILYIKMKEANSIGHIVFKMGIYCIQKNCYISGYKRVVLSKINKQKNGYTPEWQKDLVSELETEWRTNKFTEELRSLKIYQPWPLRVLLPLLPPLDLAAVFSDSLGILYPTASPFLFRLSGDEILISFSSSFDFFLLDFDLVLFCSFCSTSCSCSSWGGSCSFCFDSSFFYREKD